jgi:hypothetical protein
MSPLPPSILAILAPFASLFCKSKTWMKALTLLMGAILCRGSRTVCSALRIMGLKGERAFQNYHRLLNRTAWDLLQGSKILLEQLAASKDESIVISVDEHIELRFAKNRWRYIKIEAKNRVSLFKNFLIAKG